MALRKENGKLDWPTIVFIVVTLGLAIAPTLIRPAYLSADEADKKFLPRETYDVKHDALCQEVSRFRADTQSRLDRIEGKIDDLTLRADK